MNDRIPMHGHDPERIMNELRTVLRRFSCSGLLLDFQNPQCEETASLVKFLVENLECPVGCPAEYITEGAAVFLPPVPTDITLKEYVSHWQIKKVRLETSLQGKIIRLSEQGTTFSVNQQTVFPTAYKEPDLHCSYFIEEKENCVVFYTWRTKEDLQELLDEEEASPVKNAIDYLRNLVEQEKGE